MSHKILIAIDSVESQFDNLILTGGQMAKLGQTKLDQFNVYLVYLVKCYPEQEKNFKT